MDTGPPLTDEQRDFVARHHGLALHGVKKFRRVFPSMDPDDMLVACENGLIAASRTYAPEKARPSTHVFKFMFREVTRDLHKSRMIPVPERYWWPNLKPTGRFKARFKEQAKRIMNLHRMPSRPGDSNSAPSGVWVVPDHRPNQAELVDDEDSYQALLKKLGAVLTPRQMRTLMYREVDGLLLRDIADIAGCSKQAVDQMLCKIRRDLRKTLECGRDGTVGWRKDVPEAA
jgi:DNA-directed RNA polymerase specialized sigma subunit